MKTILFMLISLLVFNTALAAEPKGKAGKWVIVEKTNPADGGKTLYGYLAANKTTSDGKGEDIKLVLLCDRKITTAYVVWGMDLGEDGKILMKIDHTEEAGFQWEWQLSAGKTETVLDADDSIEFIKKIAAGKTLVLRLESDEDMPKKVSAVFDLSGINKVAVKIAKACEWEEED